MCQVDLGLVQHRIAAVRWFDLWKQGGACGNLQTSATQESSVLNAATLPAHLSSSSCATQDSSYEYAAVPLAIMLSTVAVCVLSTGCVVTSLCAARVFWLATFSG
eukprot:GHUV01046194.1.p1 GENE.GHUV01046194.1~~GHUV01046194.1.p1  ORF type:complete len:105 (-),score=20.20 GHUV01046194.1:118-432(-)